MRSFAFLFLLIIFAACEKDHFDNPGTEGNGIRKINVPVTGKSGPISILEFATDTIFLATMDSLRALTEEHVERFVDDNSNLDEEEFNDLVLDTSFDGEEPFAVFENSYNFVSMRDSYNREMDEWLNQSVLDTLQLPRIALFL